MSHRGDPEWRAAYAQLEAAVQQLHRLNERDHDEPGDPPGVLTDFVLIGGYQYLGDDDDRCGGVTIFPKDGSQPAYITTGLVVQAEKWLTS